MSETRQYTIVLVPDLDEHEYTVTVPTLPGVVAQAPTVEEAIELAKETIVLHLEGMVADGEPIPGGNSPPANYYSRGCPTGTGDSRALGALFRDRSPVEIATPRS